jgi:hypothetical protein
LTRIHLVLVALLALLLLPAAGCPVNPPNPGGAGGSVATGGTADQGGQSPVAGQPGSGGWLPIGTGGATAAGAAGGPEQTQCQRACSNLAKLGCPEDQTTCSAQCEILTHDPRFAFDVNCRIVATSKSAAQKCGVGSCK